MSVTSDKPVILAVVGHADPFFLEEIKRTIENLPHFRTIFIRTSSGKLFIVGEGDDHEQFQR